MNKGNEPAFPVVLAVTVHKGITKREYVAARILKGLLSNPNINGRVNIDREEYSFIEATELLTDVFLQRFGKEE